MKYELRGYQRDAAIEILKRIRQAREAWTDYRSRSSFALSAITGSGKTVIAAAAIEALFFGSTDLDAEPDPRVAFLWITDAPALNRQTRARMNDASELLGPSSLREVDEAFPDRELVPGRVYFLNTQKLSRASRLVQTSTDLRELSFWDVLRNTINGGQTDLIMVLDEAHRGVRRPADRPTIVHRLINGERGSNPPVPVVWGISATIDRFTRAMGRVPDRVQWPNVEVDVERVRASGLVKDEIGLDQPAEQGTFSTTLLREAVRTTRSYEDRWAAYSASENEPTVLPVLVVQVPDRASDTKLRELVELIDAEWPDLGPRSVAHVLGEHQTLTLGSRIVDWVYPESIQTETEIRVVLAKEAISTGWDCPRAEVLYSERPANDATHIAQIIGRMVRQPLAHRIATDDALNSVMCYLPLFDRRALTVIKNELEGMGPDNGQNKVGPKVARAPMVFERSRLVEREVFDVIANLPSIPKPDPTVNPIRRARTLARLLADDSGGSALLPDANRELTDRLCARLDGLAVENSTSVITGVENLLDATVLSWRMTTVGNNVVPEPTARHIATHARDVERDCQRAINAMPDGLGKAWFAHRVAASPDADRASIRVECAALLGLEGIRAKVEATATEWVQDKLDRFRVAIANTTGSRRDAFTRVREQAASPEVVTVDLRDNQQLPTKDSRGDELPRCAGHLYCDADNLFPVDLNDWELRVVETEIARPEFITWYRNPGGATPSSLRIAYKDDEGKWASLQPDFLIVSLRTDGTPGVSIIDPHGDYLADARAKLQALAEFAARFADRFVRVESVVRVDDGTLRVLDLTDPAVRAMVLSFQGAKVTGLYQSDLSQLYA